MGCSFRLAARVLLYTPSHRQDDTYHGLCYTSRGALAGMKAEIEINASRVTECRNTVCTLLWTSLVIKAVSGTCGSVSSVYRKEGNVLFNDTLNTFHTWLYGVRGMVK